MPAAMQVVAHLFPLTYAVDVFRQAVTEPLHTALLLRNMAALTAFLILFLALATRLLKKSYD
jgi:uncharacterized phage infection (PIP) family protein YhgE